MLESVTLLSTNVSSVHVHSQLLKTKSMFLVLKPTKMSQSHYYSYLCNSDRPECDYGMFCDDGRGLQTAVISAAWGLIGRN